MKFTIGKNEMEIEKIIEWLGATPGNVEMTKSEAKDLSNVIQTLYNDNKMMYGAESEFARDD
jgi:hypothetical protein